MSDTPHPFDGARLKVNRADKHIHDFDGVLQAFVESQPYQIFQYRADAMPVLVFDKPLPAELMLIAGDAIHNLRTALDHVMWELVGLDGTQGKWTRFPVGSNRQNYEKSIGAVKAPRDTLSLFIDLAVYPEGRGDALYRLHELDISDKHLVIVPVIERGRLSGLKKKSVNPITGERVETILPDRDVEIGMPDAPYSSGRNARGLAILGRPGAVQFDNDTKVVPNIFFRDVQPFPGKPIFQTLIELELAVAGVIERFADFVRRR